MKIVILDGRALNPGDLSYDCIGQFGDVTLYQHTQSEEEAIARIGDSEIVLVNKVPIRKHSRRLPQHQADLCPGHGYNLWTATPAPAGASRGKCARPTGRARPSSPMALILEMCHRRAAHQSVPSGRLCRSENFCYWLSPMELGGKTWQSGLWPHRPGRWAVAKAFGMRVSLHRIQCDEGGPSGNLWTWTPVWAQSNILTLHCPVPGDGEDHHGTHCRMKDAPWLVNTAGVACWTRKRRELGSADSLAAVTWFPRSPRSRQFLLSSSRCIITPHIAWPVEKRQRCWMRGIKTSGIH